MPDETEQAEPPAEGTKKPRHANATGLLVVGVFKLTKAAFFTTVGAVAYHLVHVDLGRAADQLIYYLRFNSEGRLASFLMDRADLIGHHQLREAGVYALIYAGLCLIEGVGLILHKVWAEYFTVILTTLFLPLEIFELLRRFEVYKIGLIVANVAVVLYLLWVLKKKAPELEVVD
jgi:uncharacterized membrane protein (DUF2068 family)